MHALVSAVLLRLARFDPLVADAELQPPRGELTQPACTPGCERRSVVRSDRIRQPVLTKRRFEDGLHLPQSHLWEPFAANQESAVAIHQSQWVASLSIAGPEVALEVRTPHSVGALAVRQWPS